jgi:hypothetical protein
MDVDKLKAELVEIDGALSVIIDGLDVQPGSGGDAVRLVQRRLAEIAPFCFCSSSGWSVL